MTGIGFDHMIWPTARAGITSGPAGIPARSASVPYVTVSPYPTSACSRPSPCRWAGPKPLQSIGRSNSWRCPLKYSASCRRAASTAWPGALPSGLFSPGLLRSGLPASGLPASGLLRSGLPPSGPLPVPPEPVTLIPPSGGVPKRTSATPAAPQATDTGPTGVSIEAHSSVISHSIRLRLLRSSQLPLTFWPGLQRPGAGGRANGQSRPAAPEDGALAVQLAAHFGAQTEPLTGVSA